MVHRRLKDADGADGDADGWGGTVRHIYVDGRRPRDGNGTNGYAIWMDGR